MKLPIEVAIRLQKGRAPPGARGLKHCQSLDCAERNQSRSARGAWIETFADAVPYINQAVALRPGRVD